MAITHRTLLKKPGGFSSLQPGATPLSSRSVSAEKVCVKVVNNSGGVLTVRVTASVPSLDWDDWDTSTSFKTNWNAHSRSGNTRFFVLESNNTALAGGAFNWDIAVEVVGDSDSIPVEILTN